MKKLVKGIVEFRQNLRPSYQEKFASLALGQSPDTLLITCSDSRVAPNVFASTDPGDVLVVRNVGNLVPPCFEDGMSSADESEAAAIEFAVLKLGVSDIVICGHSECAAMKNIMRGRELLAEPNLRAWLRHGEASMLKMSAMETVQTPHNHLSQQNVLQQIEHIKSYPFVNQRVQEGTLRLHGWWFELQTANVYAYDAEVKKFVVIDEECADRIISRLEKTTN